MKTADIKSNTYFDSSKENNEKDHKSKIGDPFRILKSSKENNEKYLKFKIADIVRISKYENIFAKDYTPNWP